MNNTVSAAETIATRWMAAFNQADISALREYCAPDVIVHAPTLGDAAPSGLDRLERLFQAYRTAFPDGRLAIEGVEVQGPIVQCRWIATGVNAGPFLHVPPTNATVTTRGGCRFRLADGLLAEHWFDVRLYDLFAQLGAVCAPAGKADEASHAANERAFTWATAALAGDATDADGLFHDDVVVHTQWFKRRSTATGRPALDRMLDLVRSHVRDVRISTRDCTSQGRTSTYRGTLSGFAVTTADPVAVRLDCMFRADGSAVAEFWIRIAKRMS